MGAVDISGNARLATEILALLRYLRWDVEEDLSRIFGDVIAHAQSVAESVMAKRTGILSTAAASKRPPSGKVPPPGTKKAVPVFSPDGDSASSVAAVAAADTGPLMAK